MPRVDSADRQHLEGGLGTDVVGAKWNGARLSGAARTFVGRRFVVTNDARRDAGPNRSASTLPPEVETGGRFDHVRKKKHPKRDSTLSRLRR